MHKYHLLRKPSLTSLSQSPYHTLFIFLIENLPSLYWVVCLFVIYPPHIPWAPSSLPGQGAGLLSTMSPAVPMLSEELIDTWEEDNSQARGRLSGGWRKALETFGFHWHKPQPVGKIMWLQESMVLTFFFSPNFKVLFCVGVWSVNKVMLVSGDQWRDSAIHSYVSILPQVVPVVRNPSANAGDLRDVGSIPGSRRSAGGGHGNPFQYSCLENPTDKGAW